MGVLHCIGMVFSRLVPLGSMVFHLSLNARSHLAVTLPIFLGLICTDQHGITVSQNASISVVLNIPAHYSAQYAGGALGPIVIHGPLTADYDIDLGPIMLSDWYHSDYFTLVNGTMNGVVSTSNNNLVGAPIFVTCANSSRVD
jgi:hypothetical protein